jgi:2-(1,2-epoxy-1,2-dihydrophenyl)acetyl-CoA isomerase
MAISRFNRMDAPVVIAVNGAAAGAGFSLALAGDFAIAGESVKLTMAYTRAGLTPDGSSTYFLPRLVGPRRARELVLANRTLTAAEALDWGLITRVVPDAEVLDAARALARELAHGPTRAYGLAKRLLDGSLNASLETAMEDEAQAIAAAARTADAREGMRAFIEKRQPTFKGE